MAQKQFKIGLSNADKQNMAQNVYERVLALTFNEYDTTTEYEVGDFVVYNDQLYKCISATSGAWDSSKWQLATLNDLVTDIENAVAFVNDKANVNGNYPTMTVGNADQLNSTVFVVDKVPYLYRTSGGDTDIGNREYDKIIGGSLAVNQLIVDEKQYGINNGNAFTLNNGKLVVTGTSTISTTFATAINGGTKIDGIKDHKYFIEQVITKNSNQPDCRISFYLYKNSSNVTVIMNNYAVADKSTIWNASTDFDEIDLGVTVKNGATNDLEADLMWVDLTTTFGSLIANYIYSLEQANAGAGVAWFRKYFNKPYYPYNAGAIKNVKLVSHDMVGFNQWDEVAESGYFNLTTGEPVASDSIMRSANFIRVNANTNYYYKSNGANHTILFYDNNYNYISNLQYGTTAHDFTTPQNCAYIKFAYVGTTYNHDICINLSWSGWRNGQYEPYQKNSYPLDTTIELRGIPKLDNNNNLYFDGDEYSSDGKVVRKYGIVDLGTLDWSYHVASSDYSDFFDCYLPNDCKVGDDTIASNIICGKGYKAIASGNIATEGYTDKVMAIARLTTRFIVFDTSYNDATAFKTAMSGVYLVYELATPTEENAAPFQEPQIVDDFGTEEYVVPTQDGWQVPVGHDTKYPANLRDKLQRLPDMPSVSQNVTETYVVNYNGTTKKCTFVDIAGWLGTNGWIKLTDITGYDAEKTQTLKNVEGTLTWVDD